MLLNKKGYFYQYKIYFSKKALGLYNIIKNERMSFI